MMTSLLYFYLLIAYIVLQVTTYCLGQADGSARDKPKLWQVFLLPPIVGALWPLVVPVFIYLAMAGKL